MRIWLTGGTGFIGSNIVRVALGLGHEVITTVHSFQPTADLPYRTTKVDITDPDAVKKSIAETRPDAVVHCAILNDYGRLYLDRRAGWDAYVSSTHSIAAAANAKGAPFVLVSTDWVFDGTQRLADEETPPNPVNLYGVLKLASEMVALENGGAVARVSGVNGVHYARPDLPRSQDVGFGYFVASLVDSLRRGRPFTVWLADDINMVATPSLASESAELIVRIVAESKTGVFHCCGRDAVGRLELAHLACDVFGLARSLVVTGPPDYAVRTAGLIPYDTSLAAPRTSALLNREPSSLRDLLARFRTEYDNYTGVAA